MAIDLDRALETDNGILSDGVVIPSSIFDTVRSSKPTYAGDLISNIDYYNSLTQINANRIARVDVTYTGDSVTQEVVTYYKPDGVTVFSQETYDYAYTGDNVTNIEGQNA